MMVADEIRALLLIHDRLNAWERPFIREMAKRLEQRGSLSAKQLATIRRILDRHRVSALPAQAAPDQLMQLAEPRHPHRRGAAGDPSSATSPEAGKAKASACRAWQAQKHWRRC